ncbi:MAG: minor capsid protein [Oscillospiraceae bacterium]
MNNADYWKQRFEQLEDAQNALGEKTLGEIEKQYNDTLELLEARILLWYQRLADNNGISLATARAWLGSSELREFRWTVKEYIKYGKENALNQKWVKELENASAKYHISKLEALKIQTRQSLEAMYVKQGKTMQKAFSDIYRSGYYHTAYEIQHGLNIGWDISGIDQPQIEKVLSKPWAADGYNFSERIWKNKNKLISEVHTSLVQNIQLGADPQKAINDIAAKMKTSKRNAGRLVMTEAAYFSSAAQKDCFVSLGVEEYEIVATIDNHTSDICRTLDKKHFPMKDYQAGVTAPPFHVYCRSTTAPYFDDEFDVPGERAARDKDGNTYYIPADMNYREWEKTFVDGGSKEGLEAANNKQYFRSISYDGEITQKRGNMNITFRHLDTTVNDIYISTRCELNRKELHNVDKRITSALNKMKIDNSENFPKVYLMNHTEMQKDAIASYNAVTNTIAIDEIFGKSISEIINIQKDGSCPDNELSTLVHELFHWKDAQEYQKYHDKITSENYQTYIAYLNKKRKKIIDKLENKGYNVHDISNYAEDCLSSQYYQDYDEVYTEYRVKELLG